MQYTGNKYKIPPNKEGNETQIHNLKTAFYP